MSIPANNPRDNKGRAMIPTAFGTRRAGTRRSSNPAGDTQAPAPVNDMDRVRAGIARATRPRNAAPASGPGTGNS